MEAAMAIWSGVEAGSLVLLAFGFDSLTELASAIVLIWRLDVELRRGEVVGEQAERTAALDRDHPVVRSRHLRSGERRLEVMDPTRS